MAHIFCPTVAKVLPPLLMALSLSSSRSKSPRFVLVQGVRYLIASRQGGRKVQMVMELGDNCRIDSTSDASSILICILISGCVLVLLRELGKWKKEVVAAVDSYHLDHVETVKAYDL